MRKENDQMNIIAKWATAFTVVFIFAVLLMGKNCQASPNTYTVSVAKGYLALRTKHMTAVTRSVSYTQEMLWK